jgi:3'-phosphoadenosine 5'-phosphosulfate sulfotransferase (PAPS reductase)/FAD synthetase
MFSYSGFKVHILHKIFDSFGVDFCTGEKEGSTFSLLHADTEKEKRRKRRRRKKREKRRRGRKKKKNKEEEEIKPWSK